MWRMGKVSGFLVGACIALLASEASAVPVYGTGITIPGDLSGSRSLAGGGLSKGAGSSASFTTATVDWLITSNQDNTLHYHYSIDTNSPNGVSHFIFDLSDNCMSAAGVFDTGCMSNVSVTGGTLGASAWDTYTATSNGNSNPGMPGSITGMKIDVGSGLVDFTFDFDSARTPVWGDFYTKGGKGTDGKGFVLFNTGLGAEGTDGSTNDFIAMPDSTNCAPSLCGPPCTVNCGGGGPPPVPEPASIALLGAGLVGASIARRKKKRS